MAKKKAYQNAGATGGSRSNSLRSATLQPFGWRYVPNKDPEASMLGEQQWRWLEAQLREPAEVRLLNSSVQVVAGEKGAESWGNFPHERRRLYDLIGKTRASGVIIVSGDVHFAEIWRTDDGPYPLYDFTSSPLARSPHGRCPRRYPPSRPPPHLRLAPRIERRQPAHRGRLLGHTQPQTTHRYAHLADDPLREAAEKIGKTLRGS